MNWVQVIGLLFLGFAVGYNVAFYIATKKVNESIKRLTERKQKIERNL